MPGRIAICLCILLISACTMPDTKIYSLHLNTPASPHPAESVISVKSDKLSPDADKSVVVHIDSPRYLSQSYIAYRNSPYQLKISRYSKWESSPKEMVRDALIDTLSSADLFSDIIDAGTVPEGFYLLEINLRRFERSDEGDDSFGVLVMDVKLMSPDNKKLYSNTISKKVKIGDKSFLNLAKGLSNSLSEAVSEIKDQLLRRVIVPNV